MCRRCSVSKRMQFLRVFLGFVACYHERPPEEVTRGLRQEVRRYLNEDSDLISGQSRVLAPRPALGSGSEIGADRARN